MTTGSFTANAAVDPKVPYSALTDFAPVTLVAESYGLALMTRPGLSGEIARGIRRTGQAQPGKIQLWPCLRRQCQPLLPPNCSRSSPASNCSRCPIAGYKEMDVIGYFGFGLWFPAGTARERLSLINREARKALEAPAVRKVILDSGVRPVGSSAEEFARYLEQDLAWQKDIIRRIGLAPQ